MEKKQRLLRFNANLRLKPNTITVRKYLAAYNNEKICFLFYIQNRFKILN